MAGSRRVAAIEFRQALQCLCASAQMPPCRVSDAWLSGHSSVADATRVHLDCIPGVETPG